MTRDVEGTGVSERAEVTSGAPPRRGRPPRISRDGIAAAAVEVGLSDLTLRAVADHLGVSIAALYHHVDGKDDLMRLAAEHSLTQRRFPEDHGQHWAVWLLEWGRYTRDAFIADPAVLEQFMDGAISPESIAQSSEAVLRVLVAQGFSVAEAVDAWALTSEAALGSALTEIRDGRWVARGDLRSGDQVRAVAERLPDALPHVRDLPPPGVTGSPPAFESRLCRALLGVALARGDDVDEVGRALDAARLPPPSDRPS